MRVHLAVATLLCAVVTATPAAAQRIAVTPFVGWETAGSYPLTDATTAQPAGDIQEMRADGGTAFGVAFDYSLTANWRAEFMWTGNPTTYSALSATTGQYSKAFNARIDQYQFGALYFLGEERNALRPFIGASLGFTHDSNGNASPGRTAFGFGLGGGIEYGVSSHVAFRTDARWMPTYGSAGLGTFCDSGYGGYGGDYGGYGGYDPYGYGGGGCYQDTIHNYLQRFNFTVGLTIRP